MWREGAHHAGEFQCRSGGAEVSRVPRRSKSIAPTLMTGVVLMAGGVAVWSVVVWLASRMWN